MNERARHELSSSAAFGREFLSRPALSMSDPRLPIVTMNRPGYCRKVMDGRCYYVAAIHTATATATAMIAAFRCCRGILSRAAGAPSLAETQSQSASMALRFVEGAWNCQQRIEILAEK
jgi:hypothetical protein